MTSYQCVTTGPGYVVHARAIGQNRPVCGAMCFQTWRIVRTTKPTCEKCIDALIQTHQAKPTASPHPDWQMCTDISDVPEVDEALRAFSEDPTADNAAGLVQQILIAAKGQ